jgi:MoxR-like ATPase
MADAAALAREVQGFVDGCTALERAVARAVVGQRDTVDHVITALLAGGHVLLEGAPGLGKTLLVRSLAEAVDLSFSRVQFTPDLMPADITGTNIVVDDPKAGRTFRFSPGPLFANLVLADEINRTTPKTQSALLEAMQEGVVTVSGTSHPLPEPFMVLATQNPIDMEGTYPLPEAQLDRFLMKVMVPFPTAAELASVLDLTTGTASGRVEKALTKETLRTYRALVRDVVLAPNVRDLAVKITLATHPSDPAAPQGVRKYVRHGASPRGAQALVACAKVRALRAGRAHVESADVKAVALPALRHRLILNFEGEAEGLSTDRIVSEVLAATS